MKTVEKNSPIHCNRCDKKFSAQSDMQRNEFWGQSAARVTDFCTCPHCNQTDNHYVYAIDIMPEFAGSPEKIRKMQRNWMDEN